MNYYLDVLRKYTVFSGRSRRREYWYFFLFNFAITLALSVLDAMLTGAGEDGSVGVLGGIYALVIFLPSLAVSVRRLHDSGRSGWWLLLALIPILGVIVLLYFMVQDSEPDTNEYGPNPKIVTA